jgi:hypothetical protein
LPGRDDSRHRVALPIAPEPGTANVWPVPRSRTFSRGRLTTVVFWSVSEQISTRTEPRNVPARVWG